MCGDLIFSNQDRKIVFDAVRFIGNLLCEHDNPDLGQRVLKETRLLEFLGKLTDEYQDALTDEIPWLVNNTLKHCSVSDEKTQDSVNVCMRLLGFAYKNGDWKPDHDSYIVLIETIAILSESHSDLTARLLFFYFDV